MLTVLSRSDAKAKGLKRYFSGIQCSRGHVTERTVSRNDCVDCLYNRQRRWNAANTDKVNARSQEWYAANLDQAKTTRSRWRAENAEKDRADVAAYQAANKDRLRPYVNANTARRTAAKLRATPSWADRVAIKAIYAEAARLTRKTGIEHHVDHIYPLRSKWCCGLHVENNLQILTAAENQSKSNRRPTGASAMRECVYS